MPGPLLADDGKPIFDFGAPGPIPEAVTPIADAVTPTQANPNLAPQPATEPPTADFAPTGAVAELPAPEPEPLEAEPVAPEPPDWDSPDNPWRQQAETFAQQAAQAQQAIDQQRATAIRQAEEQSRQRQADLMRARMTLDANVGQYSTEDFQRMAGELTRRTAAELHAANQSKMAIADYYDQQQNVLQWDQALVEATRDHGLTPQEIQFINENARDGNHLDALARDFQSRRTERETHRSTTQELARLKSEQQKARSDAAARSVASGADRMGGSGGSPVPTPAPTSALGLLRQAVNNDPRVPIRVG